MIKHTLNKHESDYIHTTLFYILNTYLLPYMVHVKQQIEEGQKLDLDGEDCIGGIIM